MLREQHQILFSYDLIIRSFPGKLIITPLYFAVSLVATSDPLVNKSWAVPAHVYPTAAKLTIKRLIMSVEFILITSV